jgi:hypothetical protein
MVHLFKYSPKVIRHFTIQNFQHADVLVHKHSLVIMQLTLTLWYQKMTLVEVQCDDAKTEYRQKLLAKNMQSNGWPLKSPAIFTVHPALNSSAEGLKVGCEKAVSLLNMPWRYTQVWRWVTNFMSLLIWPLRETDIGNYWNQFLMFCWPSIIVYQYNETNVIHFLFSFTILM